MQERKVEPVSDRKSSRGFQSARYEQVWRVARFRLATKKA